MSGNAVVGYKVNRSDGSLTFLNYDVSLPELIAAADDAFAGVPHDQIEVYRRGSNGKYNIRVALRALKRPEVRGEEGDAEYGRLSCHPQALYTLAQIVYYALLFPQYDRSMIKVNTDSGFDPLNYIFLAFA